MLAAESGQRLHQVFLEQQLQHGGAFAAGDNQAIDASEVTGRAHFDCRSSDALYRLPVRVKIALQCEDADSYQPRVCISSDSCSLEMSRPGMPMPSSSLASSSLTGSL